MLVSRSVQIKTINGGDWGVYIFCPGCVEPHRIPTHPEPGRASWTFDGNYDLPTLSPSLLRTNRDAEGMPVEVCHSFITDGRIQFLADCTHSLAGQTVDLPECRPYAHEVSQ